MLKGKYTEEKEYAIANHFFQTDSPYINFENFFWDEIYTGKIYGHEKKSYRPKKYLSEWYLPPIRGREEFANYNGCKNLTQILFMLLSLMIY